jgi:gamma-glutamylcysteine synthetase
MRLFIFQIHRIDIRNRAVAVPFEESDAGIFGHQVVHHAEYMILYFRIAKVELAQPAPGLELQRHGQPVKLADWGHELLAAMTPVAQRLDAELAGTPEAGAHTQALAAMVQRLNDLASTPSARVLSAIQSRADSSFVGFVRQQSAHTHQQLLSLPWSDAQQAAFEAESRQSLIDQKAIEDNDSLPFEIYRQEYVSPYRLGEHLPAPR